MTAAAEPVTTSDDAIRRLERRLARARRENEILERMIEDKTRSLYLAQRALEAGNVFLERILRSMQSALLITDTTETITLIGGTTSALTGLDEHALVGRPISTVLAVGGGAGSCETELAAADGTAVPVLVTTSELTDEAGAPTGTVRVATDLSKRKQLEVELRHAQRLESIGQLAAGVAHEINTPIQFVSDSVGFLGDVLDDLLDLQRSHQALVDAAAEVDDLASLAADLRDQAADADIAFIADEGPKAIDRTRQGLDRVASIVRALKQFSHPGNDDRSPVDLNEIVDNTLTVARNEYRHVADVELDAGDLPPVMCHRGDIGQALLNLIVNAANAIADRVDAEGGSGRIAITTRAEDRGVTVTIADTGGGIPTEIRNRVFEPFFTTKEPGKGTGQGLALVHNVIVARHRGRLTFDVDDGVGTTFSVWLPDGEERG